MPFKARTESDEIKILRILNTRMNLPESEKQRYLNLKKGFEGELMFDTYTSCLDNKFYILDDLQLEVNNKPFQIDKAILTQDSLVPCEVKNFEGNYLYQNDNFSYCYTKKEITNPLHQLNKDEILLRDLGQKHGFRPPVKGNLVFVNPGFFLYQAPLNHPEIIYYPHLNSFIKNLSMKPSNLTDYHQQLAELLVKSHKPYPFRSKLPAYHYSQCRKGITCALCLSFKISVGERKLICHDCGHIEAVPAAVVRSVEEIRLLFPEMKVTAKLVYDWCSLKECNRKIRRILAENYRIVGHGKYSYYVKDIE